MNTMYNCNLIEIYKREDVKHFIPIRFDDGLISIHRENKYKYGLDIDKIEPVKVVNNLPEAKAYYDSKGLNIYGQNSKTCWL